MIVIRQRFNFVLLGILVGLFVFVIGSYAAPNNSVETILDQYANNAQSWEGALRGYAQSLFWLLVLLDFAWIFVRLMIAKFDFTDFFGELVRHLFFIGFFYLLLENSTEWANAIVQSFRTAGNAASIAAGGEGNLSPSDIFDSALHIVGTAFSSFQFSFDKFGDSLAIVFSAILIMIAFALVAALEIIALVESYIVIYASIIFMGFGGSHFTSGFALKTLQYAVSVGAKLFMIQLIVGLGQRMMIEWTDTITAKGPAMESMDMISVLGGAIVLLAVAKSIPEIVQGMLNGASLATGRPLITSASAASNMAMAGVAGAAALVSGAVGGATGNPAARSFSSWASDTAVGHAEQAFGESFEVSGRMHGYHAMRSAEQSQSLANSWRSERYDSKEPDTGSSNRPEQNDGDGNTSDEKEQPNLISAAK